MNKGRLSEAVVLGTLLCIGMALLGYFISDGIISFKALNRTVVVKGLSEREVPANIAIWPIRFNEVGNDLNNLFSEVQRKNNLIVKFLKKNGFKDEDISISAPTIADRQAQIYSDPSRIKYRYSGGSTITVYTHDVASVREAMTKLSELGKQGVAIAGESYDSRIEFLYTKLNEIKPEMIEEATKNAREVAEKFAKDSNSKLGKIKSARQGQFSIINRDRYTPYIKKVRVVSTLEYYLSD